MQKKRNYTKLYKLISWIKSLENLKILKFISFKQFNSFILYPLLKMYTLVKKYQQKVTIRTKETKSRFASHTNKSNNEYFLRDIYIFSIGSDKSSEIFGQQSILSFSVQSSFFDSSNPELEKAYRNRSSRINIVREG